MTIINFSALASARSNAIEAGRILSLLKLPITSGYRFSPMLSIYGDMLDPETTDPRQFAACLRAAAIVDAQLIVEKAGTGPGEPSNRYHDPFRHEWRGDMRAVLMGICARHLAEAQTGFEAAGVKPVDNYTLIIS